VSERLRGEGLGHKLMQGSLQKLAQSGVHTCVIDWTRLLRFYGQFGFAPWRRYHRATKPLS
jgi:predicted N-acetyltransferase YhbS